jgi:hypothetical protein
MFDNPALPKTGFVRLSSILAPHGPIPVSKSTWWAGIKAGLAPFLQERHEIASLDQVGPLVDEDRQARLLDPVADSVAVDVERAGGFVDRVAAQGLDPPLHTSGTCRRGRPARTLMRRFVSRARLAAIAHEFNVQVTPCQESLRDTGQPRPDCHFSDKDQACQNTTPKTSGSSAPTSGT